MPIPLLLPLLWWSTASFAADDAPAPTLPTNPVPPAPGAAASGATERPVASQAEVAAYVGGVRQQSGGTLLLAAAGPEAEHLALKVAGTLPPGQVRVLRIGYIGDPADEMRRALDAAGLRCGVRLAPTAGGAWLASTHGACAPPLLPTTSVPPAAGQPDASASAPPSTPAPVPAPHSAPGATIPGLGSALPGVRVASAPSPAAPATVPGASYLAPTPPPPDPAVLAATYKIIALNRVDNPNPREDMPDATWAVRDGRGRTLGALDFARRTGDSATGRRIEREARGARSVGLALAVGGGALVVAGLGVLVARDVGAPQWSRFEPDNAAFTNAEYFEALAQAEADFRAAEEAHFIKADDRVWIAGFMIGTGALAAGTSPLALRGAADRQGIPALYWDIGEADALIDGHNTSVRQRIGLPDPVAPEAVPPPRPMYEDDDDFGLEELEPEPPEPDTDVPGPVPAPGGPSGRLLLPGSAPAPGFTVAPFFAIAPASGSPDNKGFGVAGVSGTF